MFHSAENCRNTPRPTWSYPIHPLKAPQCQMAFYIVHIGGSVGLSVNKWMRPTRHGQAASMPPCKQHLPHLRLLVQAHALKQASTAMKFLAMPFSRLAFEAANETRPHLLPRAGKMGRGRIAAKIEKWGERSISHMRQLFNFD